MCHPCYSSMHRAPAAWLFLDLPQDKLKFSSQEGAGLKVVNVHTTGYSTTTPQLLEQT